MTYEDGKKTILLVDDDRDMREMLTEIIQKAGYNVDTAAEGQEALDYLMSKPAPSLLLLDIHMPGMNGRDLLTAMNAAGIELPIIFQTASGALAPAGYEVLAKPYGVSDLLSAIERACA